MRWECWLITGVDDTCFFCKCYAIEVSLLVYYCMVGASRIGGGVWVYRKITMLASNVSLVLMYYNLDLLDVKVLYQM